MKFFRAYFSYNIFRQPIIYSYQFQSASSFDLEKVPIPEVNDMSSMCRACTSCQLFPVITCLGKKHVWKCSGLSHKAHLCIRPRMAIYRVHFKGARLKSHSASASDIPSSHKTLSGKNPIMLRQCCTRGI